MKESSHTGTVVLDIPQNVPPETEFTGVTNATTEYGSVNTVTLTFDDGATTEIEGEGVVITSASLSSRSETGTTNPTQSQRSIGEHLADAVNTRISTSQFKQDVTEMHNSIQRYLFEQILKPGIIALAETPQRDPRNGQTVKKCQRICDSQGWEYGGPDS